MNEERRRILKMLAEGKITAAEAEDLLDALGKSAPRAETPGSRPASRNFKFLYVKVTGRDTVDVRVPLGLVRAGMRLATLIPKPALDHINQQLHEKGVALDLNHLKPEHMEELIKELGEMEINVNSREGDNVKVFCGE